MVGKIKKKVIINEVADGKIIEKTLRKKIKIKKSNNWWIWG